MLRSRRVPWWYLMMAAPLFALHVLLQYATTGTPLPAEMTLELFNYRGSYWITEVGRARETIPRWQWGLEMLLGPQGWLTTTPLLALGLIGLARCLARGATRRGRWRRRWRSWSGLQLWYYTWGVHRMDFAGLSFGTRHLLPVAPLCLIFAVTELSRWRLRGVAVLVFLVCWLVGAVYAWEGMLDPWSRIERRRDVPLILLQRGVLYPWSSYQR